MAGKKKEGLAGLKATAGGLRRDDRLVINKSVFEPISIDAKNAQTVVYMLQSPEENVVLKAIASFEGFGGKGEENLRLLHSLGISNYILPLIHSNNFVIKRFSQKLIGMLCSLEEFRDQMLSINKILDTFVEVLEKEVDVVMHEFAALTLAELSCDCEGASNLLKVDKCIPTLFQRITSPDPDVQKNCLEIMNHLLNDVYGIETFVDSPGFDIKDILLLTPSRYPDIQILALEVLKQLLSWRRDDRIHFAFRDALGIETALDIMEKEEWEDLHPAALDLLINVVDPPSLCDYLLQTGCLTRIINLLDTVDTGPPIEKILGVLARMAQTKKGRQALHKVDMIKRFAASLCAKVDAVLEASILAIANMAHYGPCLRNIMDENPIPQLLDILINREKNLNLRNLAAHALNVLANEDKTAAATLLSLEKFVGLCDILIENYDYPSEFCRNVIQIFEGIAAYHHLRENVISESTMEALICCIQDKGSALGIDSSVQMDALECLSEFLIECKAQKIFNSMDGAKKVIFCMKSKFASVREWAGQLVIVASQNLDFVKSFIRSEGLDMLIREKNTRYSMPSWDSAIEAIFSAFLPAKFAFTGRLDFQDITQKGFYASSRPRLKFILIEEYLENISCPIYPIYVVNFEGDAVSIESDSIEVSSYSSSHSESKSQPQIISEKTPEAPNLSKYMKGSNRNSEEVYKWTGSLNTYPSVSYAENASVDAQFSQQFTRLLPDPYLAEYLENLRKRITKEESEFGDVNWFCIHPQLVRKRARIIAKFVAEEMSGAEPHPLSTRHYKEKVINEMKHQLGTTIFPLGYIRMGDYLERAILFKVLSDRIGFPCALVRGSFGRAWVEIAIPVLNIEEVEKLATDEGLVQTYRSTLEGKCLTHEFPRFSQSSRIVSENRSTDSTVGDDKYWFSKLQMEYFKAFPTHFLKPNAVVDLIDEPGRIMKLNSHDADEYCGNFLLT